MRFYTLFYCWSMKQMRIDKTTKFNQLYNSATNLMLLQNCHKLYFLNIQQFKPANYNYLHFMYLISRPIWLMVKHCRAQLRMAKQKKKKTFTTATWQYLLNRVPLILMYLTTCNRPSGVVVHLCIYIHIYAFIYIYIYAFIVHV